MGQSVIFSDIVIFFWVSKVQSGYNVYLVLCYFHSAKCILNCKWECYTLKCSFLGLYCGLKNHFQLPALSLFWTWCKKMMLIQQTEQICIFFRNIIFRYSARNRLRSGKYSWKKRIYLSQKFPSQPILHLYGF